MDKPVKNFALTRLHLAIVLSVFLFAFLTAFLSTQHFVSITTVFFALQDRYVGVAISSLLLAALVFCRPIALPKSLPSLRTMALASATLAAVLWLGTYAIMSNYPLTRDEHMVVFDMGVFRAGKLAQPLPEEWAGFALALVPGFLLDLPGHQMLVSAYMPMNAALRAGFSLLLDPALLNPVFTAIGLVLIYRLARRLLPDSAGAVWTVLIAYVLSAQILVNAMTAYAMAGHLFLNLLWLTLFLDGRRAAFGGAMVVGFVAIGYHQVIFHPLFAAPFILGLAIERRWRPFLAFAVVYAAAGAFWISYPNLVAMLVGLQTDSGSAAGAGSFLQDRVLPLLTHRDPQTAQWTLFNLLRTLTWAPAFLVPLLIMALPAVRDREGIAPHLACGVALTVVAMIVVLPYQGHGWGYRYLHPVMGNLLLLTGYGYRRAARDQKAMTDRLVIMLGGATALLIMPFLLVTTGSFIAPYARLTDFINRQTSDFVILDTNPPSAAIDQVRNAAALDNRPLVFASNNLSLAQVDTLCSRGSVTLVDSGQFSLVTFWPYLPYEIEFDTLARHLKGNRPIVTACLR